MRKKRLKKFRDIEIKYPDTVTLNDLALAYQMGYEAIIGDGQVKKS
jgi:hypothetical protein